MVILIKFWSVLVKFHAWTILYPFQQKLISQRKYIFGQLCKKLSIINFLWCVVQEADLLVKEFIRDVHIVFYHVGLKIKMGRYQNGSSCWILDKGAILVHRIALKLNSTNCRWLLVNSYLTSKLLMWPIFIPIIKLSFTQIKYQKINR